MSHYINYESGRHGDLNKTLTNIGSPSGFLSFFFNVHPLKRKNTQAYNDISSLVSSSSHSSFFFFFTVPCTCKNVGRTKKNLFPESKNPDDDE
jgi:hypothetical protein